MITVKFNGKNLQVKFEKYQINNRLAIDLVDLKTGEPYAGASVNLPEIPLNSNEIAIKNYAENEGIDIALIEAGILDKILFYVDTGYVKVPVYKMNTSYGSEIRPGS